MNNQEDITWTEEALRRVEKAPDFVRPGIYKLMVKKAKERGYKVITSEFLTEIRNESMMLASQRMKRLGFDELRIEAFDEAKKKMKDSRRAEVIEQIKDFLTQRTGKNEAIIDKFKEYLGYVDDNRETKIEVRGQGSGVSVGAALGPPKEGQPQGLPLQPPCNLPLAPTSISWTPEAIDRLKRLPGFVREMAKGAIEKEAEKKGVAEVTPELMAQVYDEIVPEFVKKMIKKEKEKGEEG